MKYIVEYMQTIRYEVEADSPNDARLDAGDEFAGDSDWGHPAIVTVNVYLKEVPAPNRTYYGCELREVVIPATNDMDGDYDKAWEIMASGGGRCTDFQIELDPHTDTVYMRRNK